MEKTKQKSKKDKPNKYTDKDTPSSFIVDVKTLKENLKIREILRTVKMNSSMRIKAPRGSKVMQNKDFNDNEDIFEATISGEGQDDGEPPSATNTVINTESDTNTFSEEDCLNNEPSSAEVESEHSKHDDTDIDNSDMIKPKSVPEGLEDPTRDDIDGPIIAPTDNYSGTRSRDRKLSLDQTLLLRREGLSQSEVDLHSIGKSPLERKSSFFRKKMDSFLRNTTEIFKRQSISSKPSMSPLIQRRGSNTSRMSVSLQSLNENHAFDVDDEPIDKNHEQGSVSSLRSSATPARSNSSVSVSVSDRPPDQWEEESLASSQHLVDSPSTSIPSLNENDFLMNTRAISMSSGLDTANGQRRRKTSRSNRVTWLASEGLTDYFRRLIQDEKGKEIHGSHSYQDLTIPENNMYGSRLDSKGRRLSYVRAVSGEDPALPTRYQDSSFRRKKIHESEEHENQPDIETVLESFTRNGIPTLEGFTPYEISEDSDVVITSFDCTQTVERYFTWLKETKGLTSEEEQRQEVIKELVYSEAQYILYLRVIVSVYIAAAHALQNCGVLLDFNTSTLFPHIPDLLNANTRLWETTLYPLIKISKATIIPLDYRRLIDGFNQFPEIFEAYEEYVQDQPDAVEYLRLKKSSYEFNVYVNWCNQFTGDRLMLTDMLIKPMQRLTKYSLLIKRIAQYTTDINELDDLEKMDNVVKSFTQQVNRAVRQKEEFAIIEDLKIEPYEPDFKGDDDMEKAYKKFSKVNLYSPMIECGSNMNRCLVHQGDLRYKDSQKEFDAHILLFTDMILICKKHTKSYKDKDKKENHYKMQRPRIFLHRTIPISKPAKATNEQQALIYVVLDEQGCSKAVFQLSPLSRDPNQSTTLKLWESKVFEAMVTYALTKWYYKYPVADLFTIEKVYHDDNYKKDHPDVCALEKRARVRLAAMLHPNTRHHIPARDSDILVSATDRERGPSNLHTILESGVKNYNAWRSRSSSFHQSTTSRSSHVSSVEYHVSMSGGSHEELRSASLQRSGSSVEQNLPPCFDDDTHRSPSITLNAAPDCDNVIQRTAGSSRLPSPPTLVLQQSSPRHSPGPRSASAGGSSENTLRVTPSHTIVHSLPNINAELHGYLPEPKHVTETASEKLYRSHQELMQRNRLAAGHHYLSPDHRGSSYPPPSPTRASLKRGLAFSYSFKSNPPLTRSRNVHSDSAVQIELNDVPRRLLGRRSPQGTDQQSGTSSRQRSPSPCTKRSEMPATSGEKPHKKKSLFHKRSKESTGSVSPERSKGEQIDDTDYEADDDRSRRSSKSNKGEKVKHTFEARILEDQDIITAEPKKKSDTNQASGNPEKKAKGKG